MRDELLPAVRCPACDDTALRNFFSPDNFGIDLNDPMLTGPIARLYAIALTQGIEVTSISEGTDASRVGLIAVRTISQGKAACRLSLIEDIEDDLLADLLAFGITTLTLEQLKISRLPMGRAWLGRERLRVRHWRQAGHVAWHMARECGRTTTSAMFELIELQG